MKRQNEAYRNLAFAKNGSQMSFHRFLGSDRSQSGSWNLDIAIVGIIITLAVNNTGCTDEQPDLHLCLHYGINRFPMTWLRYR